MGVHLAFLGLSWHWKPQLKAEALIWTYVTLASWTAGGIKVAEDAFTAPTNAILMIVYN